jgi:hypothetical protein
MYRDAVQKNQFELNVLFFMCVFIMLCFRFRLVGRYLWMISVEFLSTKFSNGVDRHEYAITLAEIYYAFSIIYNANMSPVTTRSSDRYANGCAYVVHVTFF